MKGKSLRFLRLLVLLIVVGGLSSALAQTAPTLNYPADGATVWENPVRLDFSHSWDPTVSFDLEVATNSGFTSPILQTTLTNNDYGYYLTVNPGTHYWWRVRAKTSSSTGGWVTRSFTTVGTNTNTNYTLSVSNAGSGTGTVTKSPDAASYSSGTSVTITATPSLGSTFTGWSGDASGTTNPLMVNVTSDMTIIANFSAIPAGTYTLNVSTTGTGSGTVTKVPDSISYHSGTIVQLTATPSGGSTFDGWSGDASGNTNPLSVTMSANKNITVAFNLIPVNTYYVNSSNASVGDGSLANPFQNFNDAIAASKASNLSGNNIIVLGGTYNYFVDIDDDSVNITASSPATVQRFAILANGVSISGFTVTNQTSLGAGINANGISNLTLTNMTATADSAWGGYFIDVDGLNISNSSFNSNANSLNPFGGVYLEGCTNISFSDVTANDNKRDGFVFTLISNGTFNNLTARGNTRYGLNLNESSSINFVGGDFSKNLDGMHIHPHYDADINASDTISGLTFTGTVKADSNSSRGIVLMTDGNGLSGATNDTYISSPAFNGDFELMGNGTGALFITGNVTNPTFNGFKFYGSSYGVRITGLSGSTNQPSGVKINNSQFHNYAGTGFSDYAIELADAALLAGKYSTNDVDATGNQWFGLSSAGEIEARVYHKTDEATLGLVNFSSYGFGTPTITIGSVTTNTGASFDVPVNLTLFAAASYPSMVGKIYYDSTKVRFNTMTYGTGTLFNSAGWTASAGDASIGGPYKAVTIAGAGLTPINNSGTLFKLNFTVVASVADTTNLSGLQSEWNSGAFVVQNGIITYTLTPAGPSTLRGDATMNYIVNLNDASAVLTHLSTPFLTGQALINADADLNTTITERDVHYIQYYVLNGSWPIYLPTAPASSTSTASSNATGSLEFGNLNYQVGNNQALVKIPVFVKNATDLFGVELTFTYDKSTINYQTFKQLILDNGNLAYAYQIEPGKARLYFVSGLSYNGDINPATVSFRMPAGLQDAVIHTSYRLNDANEVAGPDIKLSPNGITSVDGQKNVPSTFEVSQNYPNPFNPSTIIRYSIPNSSLVTIKVYNILGQEVRTLVNSQLNPGTYNVTWKGDDNFGQKVASGVYIYRVVAGEFVQVKKMMLLK